MKRKDPAAVQMGRELKAMRKANNLSREDLSVFLGVSSGHIGKMEIGRAKITFEMAEDLDEVFHLTGPHFTIMYNNLYC